MHLYCLQDNRQLPLQLPPAKIKLPNHNCSSTFRTLTCVGLSGGTILHYDVLCIFDCIGVQRDVCFESCECIDELHGTY